MMHHEDENNPAVLNQYVNDMMLYNHNLHHIDTASPVHDSLHQCFYDIDAFQNSSLTSNHHPSQLQQQIHYQQHHHHQQQIDQQQQQYHQQQQLQSNTMHMNSAMMVDPLLDITKNIKEDIDDQKTTRRKHRNSRVDEGRARNKNQISGKGVKKYRRYQHDMYDKYNKVDVTSTSQLEPFKDKNEINSNNNKKKMKRNSTSDARNQRIALEPLENVFFDAGQGSPLSSPSFYNGKDDGNDDGYSQENDKQNDNYTSFNVHIYGRRDEHDMKQYTPINSDKSPRKRKYPESGESLFASSMSSQPSFINTNNNNNKNSNLFEDQMDESANEDSIRNDHDTSKSPSKSAKRWTPEEDDLLREAVQKYDGRNWKMIAAEIPGRNHFQCLQRWEKALKPGLIKGHWRPEEDQLLTHILRTDNFANWGVVAAKIPGRTAKQCRERWTSHLDPTIAKREWTEEEDQLLKALHKKLGSKWSEISELLPGRTENNVKLRMRSILSQERKKWRLEEDISLIRAKWKCWNNWKDISKYVKGRKSNSCKFRWRELIHLDRSIQTPKENIDEYDLPADSPIRLQHKEKPLPEIDIELLRMKAKEARAAALSNLNTDANPSPRSPVVSSLKKRHSRGLSKDILLECNSSSPSLSSKMSFDKVSQNACAAKDNDMDGRSDSELDETSSKKQKPIGFLAFLNAEKQPDDNEAIPLIFSPLHASASGISRRKRLAGSPITISKDPLGAMVNSPQRQYQQISGIDAHDGDSLILDPRMAGYPHPPFIQTQMLEFDGNRYLHHNHVNLVGNQFDTNIATDQGRMTTHSPAMSRPPGSNSLPLNAVHPFLYEMQSTGFGNDFHIPSRVFSPTYYDLNDMVQVEHALEFINESEREDQNS